MIGDYEPEDSWHPADRPLEQLRNLAARVALVDRMQPPRGSSPRSLLAAIAHRLELAERIRGLTDRDRLRLEQLAADLEFVRARL